MMARGTTLRLAALIGAALLALSGTTRKAVSQEGAAAPSSDAPGPTSPAVKAFYEAEAEWKELMLRLSELQYLYPKSSGRQRVAIFNEYREAMTTRAADVESALVEAARTAFRESPTSDPAIAEFLFAVVEEARKVRRLDGAAEVAALLMEGDYAGEGAAIACAEVAFWADRFDEAEEFFAKAAERGEATEDQVAMYAAEIALRRAEQERDDLPRVKLSLQFGPGAPTAEVVLELFEDQAPNTVANFITLVESGWYDGLIFHRVEHDTSGPYEVSLLQGGCPLGDGSGGPPFRIACECVREDSRNHFRGSLAMARTAQLDSAGSQFYIGRSALPHLNGGYTVFGRVISGMRMFDAAPIRNPKSPTTLPPLTIEKAEVVRKRDHDYSVEQMPLPPSMLRPADAQP